jgi:dephospho-CoA kinase
MPIPEGRSFIVVAVVGLAGSGKSEVSRVFEQSGYTRVRFGDITDSELKRKGLPLNEYNERAAREELRRQYGMAAYAKLSLPRMDTLLNTSGVVADGMYSWEEYLLLREHYGKRFKVLAVWTSPEDRYARLAVRPVRPLSGAEAISRDIAEIENLNKGGPIAMADRTILNDQGLADLMNQVQRAISIFEGS